MNSAIVSATCLLRNTKPILSCCFRESTLGVFMRLHSNVSHNSGAEKMRRIKFSVKQTLAVAKVLVMEI